MTPRTYTDEYFHQQSKLAEARMKILKAMEDFTMNYAELTTVEWISVFTAMIERMVQYEMSEEGEE